MAKLTAPIAEFMEKINDVLNDWQDLAYNPNSINQVEEMLERFYDDNNIEVSDSGRFNTDVQLTEQQAEELLDIANKVSDMDIYLEDFENKFDKAQGKQGIETLEDYAEFVDNKTQFEDSTLSSSKMSYYEYEDLLKTARNKSKWYTEDRVNKMIENAFLNKGKTGDELYDYMFKKLRK